MVPWMSWGMMLGAPRCFLEASAEPLGCVWEGGDGEEAAAGDGDGEGVPASQPCHAAEPVGAGLPRLQERQSRSSAPAPPSSYFLPNTRLVFHTKGKAGVE